MNPTSQLQVQSRGLKKGLMALPVSFLLPGVILRLLLAVKFEFCLNIVEYHETASFSTQSNADRTSRLCFSLLGPLTVLQGKEKRRAQSQKALLKFSVCQLI